MPNISRNVNDVNRTGGQRTAGPASGRVRQGAHQVVIQRNPPPGHSRMQHLDMRANTRIGTWNIRSLNSPGAARLLCDELEAGHTEMMGLQEVRWHGAGEMNIGNRQLLWSGPPEGQPRQGGVGLVLTRYMTSMCYLASLWFESKNYNETFYIRTVLPHVDSRFLSVKPPRSLSRTHDLFLNSNFAWFLYYSLSSVERHSFSDSLHSLGTASRLCVNFAWNQL